jgi:hypothetical protein
VVGVLNKNGNDPIDEIASGPGRASKLVRKAAKSGGQQIAQPGKKERAQTLYVGKRSVYQATTILSIYKNSVDPMLVSRVHTR